jgi:DNA-binding transcriptional ArsR family regulator
MVLKLQLVRDGEIVFEMPLSPTDWPRERFDNELGAIEEHFQGLSRIFSAFSSGTRLRMMSRLLEEEDRTVNFADFMRDLDLNPKIVWENARKLREGGMLTKTGRGRYQCSEFGQRTFMMMNLALRHLLETLEEIREY